MNSHERLLGASLWCDSSVVRSWARQRDLLPLPVPWKWLCFAVMLCHLEDHPSRAASRSGATRRASLRRTRCLFADACVVSVWTSYIWRNVLTCRVAVSTESSAQCSWMYSIVMLRTQSSCWVVHLRSANETNELHFENAPSQQRTGALATALMASRRNPSIGEDPVLFSEV